MGHLLIKIYLPTKFEASGQTIHELPVVQVVGDQHDFDIDHWPTDLK